MDRRTRRLALFGACGVLLLVRPFVPATPVAEPPAPLALSSDAGSSPATPPRRTALCMPREGRPIAYAGDGADHWTIDCGSNFVLPCDRGTLCANDSKHCTCRCDQPSDCTAATLYIRQTYGAEIDSACAGTACSWARRETHP